MQVVTARETEIAERGKRIELIELIEASKDAERQAIGIKIEAEAAKEAASNRAEAVRMEAEGNAEAEKLNAEAARIPFNKASGPIAGSVLLYDETINVVANQIA